MVVHLNQMAPSGVVPDILQSQPSNDSSFETVMQNFSKAVADEMDNATAKVETVALDAAETQDITDEELPHIDAEAVVDAVASTGLCVPEAIDTIAVETLTDAQAPVEFEAVNVVVAQDITALDDAMVTAQDTTQFAETNSDSMGYANATQVVTDLASSMENTAPIEAVPEIVASNDAFAQIETEEVLDTFAPKTQVESTIDQKAMSSVAEQNVSESTVAEISDPAMLATQTAVRKPVSSDAQTEHEDGQSLDTSSQTALGAQAVAPSQSFDTVSNEFEIDPDFPKEQQISREVIDQTISIIKDNLANAARFKNEISFVLNPESLGRVAIKMVMEKGVLTVELTAQRQETQSILASNLESIKEVLKNISRDNQVNQIMQDVPKDYLQDENRGNHKNDQQHEAEDDIRIEDAELTENFLSILNIFSGEEI